MGIAALKKLLPTQPFDPAQLRGRTVAVDADNLIWSFATALAAAEEPVPAPHLFGLVSRLTLYAKWGAKSVWVFDGVQPDLKEATLLERAERIEAARASGDNAQAMVFVGEKELGECRELLSALGIPWIVAPGESDAQCAQLVQAGRAWAAVTQDWDIALFGAPRALRNLTLSKTRTPELLDLDAALASAKLTRAQLVDVAMLIGTDYNDGIDGVGPVRGVGLIRKHGTLEAALAAIGREMPTLESVRDLYFAHPVDAKFEPRFGKPDAPVVSRLLEGHGIGAKRGEDLVEAMQSR